MAMVPPPSEPRNRRATDPKLTELIEYAKENHELIGMTAQRVNELVGKVERWERRLEIVERAAANSRRLQEELGVDQLNPKQKAGLPDLLDWWLDRKEEAAGIADKLQRRANISTVVQGVTAIMVVVLTVMTLAYYYHH